MDSTIIAATIALSGVALGSILAGLGYYLKTRAERLRYKNQLLLHLLELSGHYRALSFDSGQYVDEYFRICKKVFKEYDIDDSEECPKEFYELLEKYFYDTFFSVNKFDHIKFFHSFEGVLNEVSKSDPLLVYDLKRHGYIIDFFNVQNDFSKSLFNDEGIKSILDIEKHVRKFSTSGKLQALEENFEVLNFDILLVSKKCGFSAWRECKKMIEDNPYKKHEINFDGLGIEDMLVEVYKDIGLIPKENKASV